MPDWRPNILRRMLTLRQFPLFTHAALDELATMSENLEPAHFPAGTVVAPAASRIETVQLIVSGEVATRNGHTWRAREVFGALEVAAGRELASAAVATMDTETLQLPARDFYDVLEDNFGVMQSALRDLASRLIATPPPPARTVPTFEKAPFGLVERLILLRRQRPFENARLQSLSMLAQGSEEKRWEAGTIIANAGDEATSGIVVAEGTLRAIRGDGISYTIGPGQHVGFVETIAGTGHSYSLEAVTPVRALASPGRAILDVLEDHTDVGVAMVTAFARALLETTLN